jgi:hypothetical protein
MKKNSDIKITKFSNLTTKHCASITMFEELRHIKIGTYKNLVLNCREALNMGDKELYNKLKSKLPAVTFCGEFEGGRKASDLISYNNLMIIDIDTLPNDDITTAKLTLSLDKYILSLWVSPSGKGLKCLIKIDSDINKHKAVFNSLKNYFLDNYKIELDISGKDVSRLCFSSWDEHIIYNAESEIYTGVEELNEKKVDNIKYIKEKNISLLKNAYATEGLNKIEDKNTVRKIIKYLTKRDFSITETYDKWFKVAFAISYSFSYDVGEKYFLTLCRLDKSKHDEEESVNILKSCYNKRQIRSMSTISFSSIVFLAKEKGFKI